MNPPTTPTTPSVPRAAIHDLGYKRYLGTRRTQATRWRVIVRNQVGVAWRGFWRMKAWVIGAAMTTAVFVILMYVGGSKAFSELSSRATGAPTTVIDAMLPFSFAFFPWWAFILSLVIGAATVSRDLKVGAFEFYFSRPVRPLDYVLGKFVGLFLIMASVLVAGPLFLALFRIGMAPPADMLGMLILVPKALLVGMLGAAAYAALPLAFGALLTKPNHAIAAWVAFYLVVSSIVSGIALAVDMPMLALLKPSDAIASLAFELYDFAMPPGAAGVGSISAPVWASISALVGYTVLGLAITLWRVKAAERAGLGGG